MKKALSSFDVRAIVRELQVYLDWRVDKVQQPDIRHLVISIKAPKEGKRFIHFRVGDWLYVSETAPAMPHRPTNFAMMLRKRIAGCRISAIEQRAFDRIVVITLDSADQYRLVLELFGKGNAILVKDGDIVQPLTSRTWRHRDVKAKRRFEYPPPIPDPATLSADDLLEIMRESDSDIVRTLATRLNLGGRYSEEICRRAQIKFDRSATDISAVEAGGLKSALKAIDDDIVNEQRGYIVSKKGRIVDAVPLRMITYDGYEQEEFESFTKCVESYVGRLPTPQKEVDTDADTRELDRLKRKLERQETAALSLEREALEARTLGDSMFAAYGDIAHTLMTAKDLLSQSKSLEDLPGYISFDRKTALLRVEVGGKPLDLNVNGTVESNAQKHYERGKKLKGKLEGVLSALEETRVAIERWSLEQAASERHASVSAAKPTKRFWFERYRWFISSEGAVVLGGKDARTNDMLVKKHLQPGDRYVHADIHGAPSVIVKMIGDTGEQTLSEACEFAVATSKAWNARIGSGAGYWVLPEQVSKTPQSGEFLARGAFVIRGKRNYCGKKEIALGLGEISYEGESKVMCGPIGAIEAQSGRYVIIRPGDINKNVFAKVAAETFAVPIEEIQRVLPPGNLSVDRAVGIELRVSSS